MTRVSIESSGRFCLRNCSLMAFRSVALTWFHCSSSPGRGLAISSRGSVWAGGGSSVGVLDRVLEAGELGANGVQRGRAGGTSGDRLRLVVFSAGDRLELGFKLFGRRRGRPSS